MTRHLGDGVYATFDGYGLEIRVNSHESEPIAYFEPSVVHAMNRFLCSHNDAIASSIMGPKDGPDAA